MTRNHTLRDLRKAIGARLHQERLRRGLTLRQLSRRTGINETKLDQFEMGKNAINLEVLWHISCALDTGLNGFFFPWPVSV